MTTPAEPHHSAPEPEARAATCVIARLAGVQEVHDLLGSVEWRARLEAAASAVRDVLGPLADVRTTEVHDVGALLYDDARPPEEVAREVAARVGQVWPRVHVGAHRGTSSVGDLLRAATVAASAAQATGVPAAAYDAGIYRLALSQHRLEQDLHGAAERGELVLHYQPVLDLAGRGVLGCEALVRWQHPVRGLLQPTTFVPLSEACGAIHGIGRWVLLRACADAARWQHDLAGREQISVAVNVSRAQLVEGRLLDDVREALAASSLDPATLHLEVTESAVAHDAAAAVHVLHELRALGVRISLDDFGTGASSLSQLRSLPIDVLKIDKAFVDGIAAADEEWAVAAAIVQLACSLGKGTVAEGVESASQLAHLRALGCDQFQGFLEARPLPVEEFREYLRAVRRPT